ncbi:MAG: outer membrane lipoprotein carrier protein LolA [Brumimicrobium sp.]|nr:outer membrane lipoprotein carrier protein LolA [Brumimicrobium sp.]
MKYLVIAISLITSTLFAQSDEKSQNILDKMSSEIKGMNSFYVEFSMKVKNPDTGEDSKQSGHGYVKGNKYYAELGENVLISNGEKIWTVVKEEKVTYQSNANDEDEESINPKKLMTIWEEGFKSKYVKEETLNGEKVHVIHLFPTKPGEVSYHTIILYISTKDNSLKQAVMKTKDGSTMTYTVTNLEKNKEVSDSKFVYNPQKYPGYQLIRD